MSSAKTERLVNLTMALMASRRFISKAEIFRRVSGYSGSQETKERMFERDKDDLRALGIDIEVGGHDPVFEDEPGYRILPEKYQLPSSNFSGEELGLISVALDLWRETKLQSESQGMQRRFNSLGIEVEPLGMQALVKVDIDEIGLVEIAESLAVRRAIRFHYQKASDNKPVQREVHCLGLSAWHGHWYLVGEDLSKNEIRAFKLSRISTAIEPFGPTNSYEIPEDFDVRDYLILQINDEAKAHIKIRQTQANNLRYQAETIEAVDAEWDRAIVPINNFDELLYEILWCGDDAIVEQPQNLRERVIQELEKVVKNYG